MRNRPQAGLSRSGLISCWEFHSLMTLTGHTFMDPNQTYSLAAMRSSGRQPSRAQSPRMYV